MIKFEFAMAEDGEMVRTTEGRYVSAKDLPMSAEAWKGRRPLGRKTQEIIEVTAPPSSKRAPRVEGVIWLKDEGGAEHLVPATIVEHKK
jgi:hypothetical protein